MLFSIDILVNVVVTGDSAGEASIQPLSLGLGITFGILPSPISPVQPWSWRAFFV